jgi:hypothetical protein
MSADCRNRGTPQGRSALERDEAEAVIVLETLDRRPDVVPRALGPVAPPPHDLADGHPGRTRGPQRPVGSFLGQLPAHVRLALLGRHLLQVVDGALGKLDDRRKVDDEDDGRSLVGHVLAVHLSLLDAGDHVLEPAELGFGGKWIEGQGQQGGRAEDPGSGETRARGREGIGRKSSRKRRGRM